MDSPWCMRSGRRKQAASFNFFFRFQRKMGSFALFCSPASNTGGELGLDASKSVFTGPGSSGTPSPASQNRGEGVEFCCAVSNN